MKIKQKNMRYRDLDGTMGKDKYVYVSIPLHTVHPFVDQTTADT